ncbi:putative baseplate assembly protein [Nonomuraea sp. PA05]|uniref:putative baseplate assembly protein n=1 Tax=Nonomuraea sp. PA05 TaxID=2604466 RepID=UPI0011D97FE8|nr:putative baseplate assembly protein [Nonomuraea sp. PA05]TYB64801.1 putative baseplate assembly protein [Nonomuraea sp. PA05]
MALPFPVLDDRSYEQLLAELRARIPVYAPEWTDLGESDPGITLLELVAHLGESLLFRFNQIPDQTRLWLLRLLQVPPYPPERATGLVRFTLADEGGAPVPVPLGATVSAGDVPFRVGNDVTVLPAMVTAVVKARADVPADPMLRAEYHQLLELAGLDPAQAAPYDEKVLRREAGEPGLAGLDIRPAVDRTLWIAVQPPGDDPAVVAGLLTERGPLATGPLVLGFATAAVEPSGGAVLLPTQTFAPAAAGGITAIAAAETSAAAPERLTAITGAGTPSATPERLTAITGAETPAAAPARLTEAADNALIWEVSLADGTYLPVTVVRDTTTGLRVAGSVALQLPPPRLADVGVLPPIDDDLAGVRDSPPRLDGHPPAVFWLRAFPREGPPGSGVLTWAGINVADVEQVAQAANEVLGTGQGISHQELALANPAVVPGSPRIEVREDGVNWQEWTIVGSLAASGRDDRHLLLDAAAGRLQCGDGVRGRVLPAGALVRAAGYRHGGGTRGNVAAELIDRIDDPPGVRVTNPLPTTGGEEAEPLARALERIPGELARRDRAVTAGDFRELAMIPGVGRAECLPHFDPATRDLDAAGAVTVMVWPARDPRHPDAPAAGATLLQAVFEHLDPRRLVTTELYVVPPVYRAVAVSVGIAVKTGYSAIGVRRWAELVLRQYLSPLPPFGPEGAGWPLGRRVHGPELEAAVLQVEGVEYVEEALVADVSGPQPVPGTVRLRPWEVPALTALTVVAGRPPEAGSGAPQPLDPDAPAPVPVPVPKDEC